MTRHSRPGPYLAFRWLGVQEYEGSTGKRGYPAGLLIGRTSTRTVAVLGSVLGTVSFICSAFAHKVQVLYFTYSVMGGTAYSMLLMAAMVSVTNHHTRYRSLAVGIAMSGTGIGIFVCSPLIALILEEFSWSDACLLIAAAYLQTLVCAALLRPVNQRDHVTLPQDFVTFEHVTRSQNHLACSRDHVACQQNHVTCPQIHVTRSLDYLARPQDHVASSKNDYMLRPQDHVTHPLVHVTRSQGYLARPQDHVACPQDHVTCPQDHVACPQDHLTCPQYLVTCPQDHVVSDALLNDYQDEEDDVTDDHDVTESEHLSLREIPTREKVKRNILQRYSKNKILSTTMVVSTMFPQCGLAVFLLFLPDSIQSRGVSGQDAALLVSVFGISDLIGRIGSGVIGHYFKQWMYYLYTGAVLVIGTVLVATPECTTYVQFLSCSIVFGLCNGLRVCQLPVLIAEFAGPEKFGKYFGMTYTLAGVVISGVLPGLGYLSDYHDSYTPVFILTGSLISVFAFVLLATRLMVTCRRLET